MVEGGGSENEQEDFGFSLKNIGEQGYKFSNFLKKYGARFINIKTVSSFTIILAANLDMPFL